MGAVFPTSTKKDAKSLSREEMRAICEAVDIPVVAIGGINAGNLPQLAGSGVDGVAVVSAIFAQPDPGAATGTCWSWPGPWWPLMDKQFCIFDMDGTLVDSMGYWKRLGPGVPGPEGRHGKRGTGAGAHQAHDHDGVRRAVH